MLGVCGGFCWWRNKESGHRAGRRRTETVSHPRILVWKQQSGLHEDHEMRLTCSLPRRVTKQWLIRRQRKNLSNRNLDFVPFEDQHPMRSQDAEALREPLSQVVSPVLGQFSVFRSHQALRPGLPQVWRVECNQLEVIVWEGQRPEVHQLVWFDAQRASITKDVLFLTLVSINSVRMMPVEPPHATPTAGVENERKLLQNDSSFPHVIPITPE